MKSLYLILNLGTISIPFLFSFHPKIMFYKKWKALSKSLIISGAFMLVWDILYTYLGVWGFNTHYTTGYFILNLPLEEWLFFVCIPYACVFTYACVENVIDPQIFQRKSNIYTILLLIFFFTLFIFNITRLYTGLVTIYSFLLLAITAHFRLVNLTRFYISFLALLLPFLLVNGILTGSFIPNSVVWYNDLENLGVRIFTIPADDFIYAFFMILLNIVLFEHFLSRESRQSNE